MTRRALLRRLNAIMVDLAPRANLDEDMPLVERLWLRARLDELDAQIRIDALQDDFRAEAARHAALAPK